MRLQSQSSIVHALLAEHVAALPPELPGALRLDEAGLGLDSIAIAELLVAYEARFGVSAIELLEGEPITVALLLRRAQSPP